MDEEYQIRIGTPPDMTVRDLGWLWNRASEVFRVEPNEEMTWEGVYLVIDSDDGFDRGDVRHFRELLRNRRWVVAPAFERDLSWVDVTVIPLPPDMKVRDLDWMMDEVGRVLHGARSLRHNGDADIEWTDRELNIYLAIDAERGRTLRDAFRARKWSIKPDFEPAFAWLDEGVSE